MLGSDLPCLGAALGVEPKLYHIASDFLAAVSPADRGGLHGDKAVSVVFDNPRSSVLFPDFWPPRRLPRAFAKTLAWFEADPKRMAVDETANRRWDAYRSVRTRRGGGTGGGARLICRNQ